MSFFSVKTPTLTPMLEEKESQTYQRKPRLKKKKHSNKVVKKNKYKQKRPLKTTPTQTPKIKTATPKKRQKNILKKTFSADAKQTVILEPYKTQVNTNAGDEQAIAVKENVANEQAIAVNENVGDEQAIAVKENVDDEQAIAVHENVGDGQTHVLKTSFSADGKTIFVTNLEKHKTPDIASINFEYESDADEFPVASHDVAWYAKTLRPLILSPTPDYTIMPRRSRRLRQKKRVNYSVMEIQKSQRYRKLK